MEQNFDGVIEVNGEKLNVLFIFENNNKQYVVYKDSLDDIINSERYINMLNGFRNGIKCEELCKKCDFL